MGVGWLDSKGRNYLEKDFAELLLKLGDTKRDTNLEAQQVTPLPFVKESNSET